MTFPRENASEVVVEPNRQLAMEVETPLTFVVRAPDGSVLDVFREDDLATFERAPQKVWQEAAAWACVAVGQWRRGRAVS